MRWINNQIVDEDEELAEAQEGAEGNPTGIGEQGTGPALVGSSQCHSSKLRLPELVVVVVVVEAVMVVVAQPAIHRRSLTAEVVTAMVAIRQHSAVVLSAVCDTSRRWWLRETQIHLQSRASPATSWW